MVKKKRTEVAVPKVQSKNVELEIIKLCANGLRGRIS